MSIGSLLGAGLNVVPPAVCVLGIGVLAMGVWPRATSTVTYAVLCWALLIQLAGGLQLQPLAAGHFGVPPHDSAPQVSPDWTSAAVLVAIGTAAALAGGMAFVRRDLAGE